MASKEYKLAKDLPLYTAVYKLLKVTDDIMVNMQKDHKHTFGQTIVNMTLELLRKISVAHNRLDLRLITLQEFLDELNDVELLIKMCSEKGYIEQKYYVLSMPFLANIGRQAGGWLRKTQEDKCQSPNENLGSAL